MILAIVACGGSTPGVVRNDGAGAATRASFYLGQCISQGATTKPACTQPLEIWTLTSQAAHGTIEVTSWETGQPKRSVYDGRVEDTNSGVPAQLSRVGGAPLGLRCAPAPVAVHRRGALGHPLCSPHATEDWPDAPAQIRATVCVLGDDARPGAPLDKVVFASPAVEEIRIACCAGDICNQYTAYRFADP